MVWFLSGSALVMGIVSSNLFCLHICFWVGDNVYRGKERFEHGLLRLQHNVLTA